MTGQARLRKLAGDTTARGTPRRERPEPILCSGCQIPLAATEGFGLCSRCAVTAYRIATTGSPNRRPINGPKRHERRAQRHLEALRRVWHALREAARA